MLVFGGFIGGSIADYSNSIFSYNFEQNIWQSVWEITKDAKKTSPKARANAGAVIVEGKLFIYGGSNGKHTFDDFWSFDFKEKSWQQIISLQTPGPRQGITLLCYQNSILFFGGIQNLTYEANDINYFNLETQQWNQLYENTSHNYECELLKNQTQKLLQITPAKQQEKKHFNFNMPSQTKITQKKAETNQENLKTSEQFYNTKSKKQWIMKSLLPKKKQLNNFLQKPKALEPIISSVQNSQPLDKKEAKAKANALEISIKKKRQMNQLNREQRMQIASILAEPFKLQRQNTPTTEAMETSIKCIAKTNEEFFGNSSQLRGVQTTKNLQSSQKMAQATQHKALALSKFNFQQGKHHHHSIRFEASKEPAPRDGYSANLIDNKLIIFGGDRQLMAFHDLFTLDLEGLMKN